MPSAAAGLCEAAAQGSAARVASELLVLFGQVAGRPDKLQWVLGEVTASLNGPRDRALERACLAVAAAIDARPDSFDRLDYHNRQHFCEVALTVYGLCLLEQLDVAAVQLALLAALMHDVVHHAGPQPAFRQERASVDAMRALLQTVGLDASRIGQLMALVLATEPSGGTAFMAAACRAHAGHGQPAVPAGAPELAALAADPTLARLARLLCEADVLPSIGLGTEHATRVQERLSREWRRPLGRRDKLAFLDAVLQQGYIGAFFLPRVRATREALAAELHAAALA